MRNLGRLTTDWNISLLLDILLINFTKYKFQTLANWGKKNADDDFKFDENWQKDSIFFRFPQGFQKTCTEGTWRPASVFTEHSQVHSLSYSLRALNLNVAQFLFGETVQTEIVLHSSMLLNKKKKKIWKTRVRIFLTLSQTINFGPVQTERVCRRQFQIWWKSKEVLQMDRKHCGKRRNCSSRAISPFPAVFSKVLQWRHVKKGFRYGW